ncbi:MAG: hypothetical protein JWM88_1018 [Verrucomicrobia bacterium]|nr:hypothetical protein [Verrucomicrobiota bacterium]
MPLKKSNGQLGWAFSNATVKAFLTRAGGQLAPVVYRLGRRSVQPFSIAPWKDDPLPGLPRMLNVCRGDFFCAPFGGNAAPYRGERHPAHGDTANLDWTLESLQRSADAVTLHTSMRTRSRPGRVDKRLTLRPGHAAVYCEHLLSGFSGPMPIGTHPMLKLPDVPGCGAISTSGFKRGYVVPVAWEQPEARGYSWLQPGATFSSLKRVPARDGGTVDLSRYPARRGFEDLVELVGDASQPFAWNAVALPAAGYVFFTVKNPRVLRETVLWFSNGGRHYPPWNGRHCNVLGVEDVTSFFHLGLAESAKPNLLSRAGAPTAVMLSPKKPLRVAHILALAAIPRDFDEVKSITPHRGGTVRLVSRSGRAVIVPLDPDFVQ